MKIVSNIELELEDLLEHIRTILTKNPAAEVHINPPADQTIKVGGPHPASATPAGGGGKPK